MTDAVNDLLATEKPEPVVVNGQYVIPRKGEKFTRCTTFASTLDDRFSLEKWQQRMVFTGAVVRQDLYAQAAANLDDKDVLNDLCEQAIEAAKGTAGANLGTALHTFAEKVDRGEDVVIPAPWDADIKAYTATLEQNGVRVDPALMEGIVVCRDLQVAGRYDRIVTIDGYPQPLIADLKTGNIDHSLTTIAIQLAIYANADEVYDPITDTLTSMPRVDLNQALIIHLPAGQATCTLHMVDIKAGWEAAQLCKQARTWRKTPNLAASFESTASERAKWLASRVATMKDRYPKALAELAARWPEGVPTFKQGGHSDDDLLLLSLLISDVEARHEVEFEDGVDPDRRRPAPSIVEALIERASALPADLGQIVEKRGVDAGLPAVRSRNFLVAHVDAAEAILGEIEAMHTARRDEVGQLLTEITEGDAALVRAVADACGVDLEDGRWTRAQVDLLAVIRDGMSNLWLAFGETDDGINVTTVNAEARLVELYGNRKDALAAAKRVADTAGLPKPRSVAEVAASPALVALIAADASKTSEVAA